MDQNIDSTFNKVDLPNVIPGRPGAWAPPMFDILPMIRIKLPPVNGIQPGKYNLTVINITAENFVNVTVILQDANQKPLHVVSVVQQLSSNTCCVIMNHMEIVT